MKIKLLLLVSLLFAVCSLAPAQPLDVAKLDRFFDRLAEKNKAMGSLVIAKEGEVIYARTIGYSQVSEAERHPLDAASRFRIASITKMFTAVMILQLAEEGKLKLTDTLDQFFPEVPNARKITLAQILTHRSGIPNVHREPTARGNVNTLPITKDEMLALIAKAPSAFEPDTNHLYSNSGFFLLGLIVEKRTGQLYAEALAERITSKLGLKDTYVATGNIDVTRHEALTYLSQDGGWKQGLETHPSILFGAGQIISTPYDLARFVQALFELKLISRTSLDRMKTIRDGEGMGMESYTLVGKTFYGHAGGGDNYGSWLAYQPEEKLAIAYTTNAKVHPVPEIVNWIADIYYHRPFEIPAFATLTVSPEVLEKYVGVYSNADAPVKFTVTRQASILLIQAGNQTPAPLEATAEDKFQLLGGRVTLEFDAEKKQMILKRGGQPRVFTKDE